MGATGVGSRLPHQVLKDARNEMLEDGAHHRPRDRGGTSKLVPPLEHTPKFQLTEDLGCEYATPTSPPDGEDRREPEGDLLPRGPHHSAPLADQQRSLSRRGC
jgi:hypothetical protein